MKEKIAYWYRHNIWTAQMVKDAIGRIITKEEAEEILGEVIK